MNSCLVLLTAALLTQSPPQEKTRIVVPSIQAPGADEGVAEIVTELLLEALLNRHGVKALGPSDVREILTAEQQKSLLGCDQDGCMAELAGAMGADKLIAGTVGKLGSIHIVTLKLIDAQKATVVSRASTRVTKLEQIADAVGPLVDQLLGAKGRVVTRATPSLLQPMVQVEVLEPRDYCERLQAYAKTLMEKAYRVELVEERRALLLDLLLTPFKQQFDHKRSCIWDYDGRTYNKIKQDWQKSKKPDQAEDAKKRLLEWRALVRQLKLLEEAYTTGLEKEKNGAGARPQQLPFQVKQENPRRPADTSELKRFVKNYRQSQKVVARAIQAVQQGKLKKFERLFAPTDPKRSHESTFKSLSSYLKNGYQLDPCPLFILRSGELQEYAERFASKQEMTGCMRRQKETIVATKTVRLLKTGSGWKIVRW